MLRSILSALSIVAMVLYSNAVVAQSVPLQGGPWTNGHGPMYSNSGSSQPVIQDSGPAGGGAVGLGMSEGLYVARGTGTPPYSGQGTGPYGTNWCDYDAPTTNATGYHYLCMSPNTGGGGLIAYGAGGAAAQQPLNMKINGQNYEFPFAVSGIVGPSSSVVDDYACWNNTSGTLLKDCTPNGGLPPGSINAAVTYGVGSTVTDNGPLIQNALDACFAAGGGTVVLPPGVLRVATKIFLVQNCILQGAGAGSGRYPGSDPVTSKPVTVLKWTPSVTPGTGGGILNIVGTPTPYFENYGVTDLALTAGITAPTNYGISGIYFNGSSGHGYFNRLNFYEINVAITEDNVNNTAGTTYGNYWGVINAQVVYDGLVFSGGTSEHFNHVIIEDVYHVGINFVGNSDTNVFDFVIITTFGSPGSTANGITFNSGVPGSANDVFSETFGYVFVNLSQPATQTSIVVNYTKDGPANYIGQLTLNYQSPTPVVASNGLLTYNIQNGWSTQTNVMGWSGVPFGAALPSGDATFCQSGTGYSVNARSTNNRGIITVGSTAVSCIVSFGKVINGLSSGGNGWPPGASPVCTISNLTNNTDALRLTGIPSTDSFTVAGLTGGDTFSWICL